MSALLSVLVEKEQVALLAAEAEQFLDRIDEEDPDTRAELLSVDDCGPVEEDEPLFRARLIGIGYDPDRHLVLIELREDAVDEDEPPPALDESEGRIARLYATRAQVRAMVAHGAESVDAGRPKCQLCDFPMDPTATSVRAGTDASCPICCRDGEMEILGRLPWSSNATLLVNLRDDGDEMLAVYKPQQGERPLWDFPRGTLCHREVAAYEVSDALGWNIVPDTVLRDGPAGIGSVQRFVEHDPDDHYFTLLEDHGDEFRRMALFDIVINNTDRKGGHCLLAKRRHGVRHRPRRRVPRAVEGAHRDLGLRWRAHPRSRVARTCTSSTRNSTAGALEARLRPLLDRFELDAVQGRVDRLLRSGVLPEPDDSYHCYPWPMV